MPHMHPPSDDLAIAHALADLARTAILPHFRALDGVEDKVGRPHFDPVTIADKNAEAAMRERLAVVRPDDGVLGEEFPNTPGTSGRTWILDPVDGTRGFLMGLPTWGTLIALSPGSGQSPTIGIMDQPYVGERFFAHGGEAAWQRDGAPRPIHTRRCDGLGAALVATTSPDLFSDGGAPRFRRLQARVRMVRFGTDCYAYALLAAGHIDIVMEEGLRAFDIAPFVPLIEAAGGVVTDFSGRPIGPTLPDAFHGEVLALGDPSLLPAALDAING